MKRAAPARRSTACASRRWPAHWRGARRIPHIAAAVVLLVGVSLALNWVYQVVRKPSELLFPVSGALAKAPSDTWRSYGPLFHRYATPAITAEFLAALAQAEGAGNPAARTYWRWSWGGSPLKMYRPASSSVGMYQMTDATFEDARTLCIRDHRVSQDGPWSDRQSCSFNRFYARVLPRHAIELTSAYLDRSVADVLTHDHIVGASLRQRQHLAATIHLCGAGSGALYARRGFRFSAAQRCGDHDPRAYLARLDALQQEFIRLAANSAD